MSLQQSKADMVASQENAISTGMANARERMSDLERLMQQSFKDISSEVQQQSAVRTTAVQQAQGADATSSTKMSMIFDGYLARSAATHQSQLDDSVARIQTQMRADLEDQLRPSLFAVLQEVMPQQIDQLYKVVATEMDNHTTRLSDALQLAHEHATDDRSAVAEEVVSQINVLLDKCLDILRDLSSQIQQQTHVLADESAQSDARAQTFLSKHNDTVLRCA
jgi:hypothetical protein